MKKHNIIKNIIIALVACTLLPCCSNNIENSGRTLMVINNKEQFKAKAVNFTEYAKNGNVYAMMKITSKKTIHKNGESQIIKIYKSRIIPAFHNTSIAWDNKDELIHDKLGNAGFKFNAKATGKNNFSFYITVFGEDGDYMIGSIVR